MRDPRARVQRGFTLIEMMIVVAVIAILAVVAIPAFFSTSRKGKAASETSAMFAELSTKEEQYKVDQGGYFGVTNTATTGANNSPQCPFTPQSTTQSVTLTCMTSATWTTLHINPPSVNLFCGYQIFVGPSTAPPVPPAPFHMSSDGTNPAPLSAWYYIIATCDMDGNAGRNSQYFVSSMDTRIQSTNEGY